MNIPPPLIPEDAFVAMERTELIHLCRKMERERDQARKEINSLFGALAAIQDAIGCGCGGDYGLCEDCSEAYNKTDELIKARETKPTETMSSPLHSDMGIPISTPIVQPDEATERLNHAEILLSDLASGYWRAVLNDQDPSGEGLMGERVAQYQARYC
jgi:hypothetical protein